MTPVPRHLDTMTGYVVCLIPSQHVVLMPMVGSGINVSIHSWMLTQRPHSVLPADHSKTVGGGTTAASDG